MKKVFTLFIAMSAIALLQSCTSSRITTRAETWVKNHCKEEHTANPDSLSVFVYLRCDSIHSTKEVNALCSNTDFCYNPAKGTVKVALNCGGTDLTITQKAVEIFKAIKKAIFK